MKKKCKKVRFFLPDEKKVVSLHPIWMANETIVMLFRSWDSVGYEIENNKFSKHKESISNEQKSDNTLVNSDDDEDELEESSNMSCDEENIIDVWRIELLLCNILNVNTYEFVIFIKNNNTR